MKLRVSREKKKSDYYCLIVGSDYPYYEKIVDSAFERLGLLEHIPRIKKAGK